MRDFRRVPALAILFLIVLRMSIGWQFLYEGLWKVDSWSTAKPWTAAGYLKNARGPMRDRFRNMTGDPDDLDWLDADKVAAGWDVWHDAFVAHHELDDDQKKRLDALLNGSPDYRVALDELPEGVKFGGSLGGLIKFEPKSKRLIVDGKQHLIPKERRRLLSLARVTDETSAEEKAKIEKYHKAVNDLYNRSSRTATHRRTGVSVKERLAAALVGDPERAGHVDEDHEGTIDHKRLGQIEQYRNGLERYEEQLAAVEQDFQWQHLKKEWSDLQALRSSLVGPVKALDSELKTEARLLLRPDQLARGQVKLPLSSIERIDRITVGALIVLGGLLIAGLFTRLAALAGACMLLSFYLAMPPWPSVPGFHELPGPEHSFIVDKNLIEVFALAALAMLPTGQWFGMDAAIRSLFDRRSKSTAGAG